VLLWKGEGVVSTHWRRCSRVATNSGHQILPTVPHPHTQSNRSRNAHARHLPAPARTRSSPRVCISARSNWTANDSICQTNEFVRCHSMPRRTARESSNWIWFNVARIAAHYTLEISQISARHPITCSLNTMQKSRAPLRLRAHIPLRVCARLPEYAGKPRASVYWRIASSGRVRPHEIPDFDIMEIAVSAYQLRARLYPVLEKHFCTVVILLVYFYISNDMWRWEKNWMVHLQMTFAQQSTPNDLSSDVVILTSIMQPHDCRFNEKVRIF